MNTFFDDDDLQVLDDGEESGDGHSGRRTEARAEGSPEPMPQPIVPPRAVEWPEESEPGTGLDARRQYRRGRLRLTDFSGLPMKGRGADLRGQYGLTIEIGLIVALLVLIGLVRAPLRAEEEGFSVTLDDQEVVQMEEIKQTKQLEQPPPPPRPPVPIEVPNDEVLVDTDLDLDATLDLDEPLADIPPPPPPPEDEAAEEEEEEIFVVVEQMPEMIGGTARLYELLEYPEIARKASVEGLVVVQVIVQPNGRPSSPMVIRSASNILDQAAIDAVMQLEFKPGMQRGKAVSVKLAVPIRFRLRDAKK